MIIPFIKTIKNSRANADIGPDAQNGVGMNFVFLLKTLPVHFL